MGFSISRGLKKNNLFSCTVLFLILEFDSELVLVSETECARKTKREVFSIISSFSLLMRGEYFWSEKAMTHPLTQQEGSTQPLLRESPMLSYKITHTFEFWFYVNWSGSLTFSFPSKLYDFAVCSLTLLSASHHCVQRKILICPLPVSDETSDLFLACLESPDFCWWAIPTSQDSKKLVIFLSSLAI